MELKSHIKHLLTKIGLTENEAKFYLAIYQNPKLSILELKKICGFSLATAYRAFESLKEQKLITSSPDSWRKNLEVVSLNTIATKLGRESLKLRKTELELKKLQNLLNLTTYQQTPVPVEIYSDQNQITEECYKLLNADWDHISAYGSAENGYEVTGHKAMSDFVTMRAKKGRYIDVVFTELGKYTKDHMKKNDKELRNAKLHIDPLCQNVMTYIYDKQVTIWQNDAELGKRAIIITDPGLIRLYASNFKKTWETL